MPQRYKEYRNWEGPVKEPLEPRRPVVIILKSQPKFKESATKI